METKTEIREFLTSRRARITPEQAGLPTTVLVASPDSVAKRSRSSQA